MRITAELTTEAATLTFTRAEALVFFEFLARFDEDGRLEIGDPAEELILSHLHGAFQRELPEMFLPDYQQKLEAAREQVRRSA